MNKRVRNNKKKETRIIINSVNALINMLMNQKCNPDELLLYRGVKDNYSLIPSIYFNKLIKHEDFIVQESTSALPEEFRKAKSTIEKLIILQHYGLPTRLLDLTANPLVGLFFSSEPYDDKDGYLYVFKVKQKDIKYIDDTSITVLSALSKLKADFHLHLEDLLASIVNIVSNILHKVENVDEECHRKIFRLQKDISREFHNVNYDCFSYETFKYHYENIISIIQKNIEENRNTQIEEFFDIINCCFITNDYDDIINNDFQHILEKIITNINIEALNNGISKMDFYKKIKAEIMSNDHSYVDSITFESITENAFLRPIWNNNRISKQEGYFILFGIENSKDTYSKVKTTLYKKYKIPNKMKNHIRKELNLIGINTKNLFHELPKFADHMNEFLKQ